MRFKLNWPTYAAISLLLLGCGSLPSPSPGVIQLADKPKPQVPADLMVPLPEPLYFQKKYSALLTDLQKALDDWKKRQTELPR